MEVAGFSQGMLSKELSHNRGLRGGIPVRAGSYNEKPGRIGIKERPVLLTNRARYGDWEGNLIDGRKGTNCLPGTYRLKTGTGSLQHFYTKSVKEISEGIVAVFADPMVWALT